MPNYIKGDDLIMSVWDGTSAYKPIACLTSNSLSQTRNIIESQTKCSPGVINKTPGTISNEMTFEGEYIDTTSGGGDTAKASHDYLIDIMNAGTKRAYKFSSGISGTDYYAEGYLSDLTLDAAAGDSITTFSGTLAIDGTVSTTDPEA